MINFQSLIYSLKQQYGTMLDIYRETDSSFDIEIGEVSLIRTKYHINKAIVLPSKISGDTPFLRRANLLFKESGQFTTDTRNIIIDVRDISIVLDTNDYIIYKNDRYAIKEINKIDNDNRYSKKVLGYHLVIFKAEKELAYEQHEYIISDQLAFAQTSKLGDRTGISDTLNLTEDIIEGNYNIDEDTLELTEEIVIS